MLRIRIKTIATRREVGRIIPHLAERGLLRIRAHWTAGAVGKVLRTSSSIETLL